MTAPEKITLSGLSRGELEVLAERLLGENSALKQAIAELRAEVATLKGLSTASWISVDDTSARHQHQNGFCTQLGNDHFAVFATTTSKNRPNFLELLRAGFGDYVINAEALAYMRQRALAGPVIAKLAEDPARHFQDEIAWLRHLARLGLTELAITPDPVRIATEGAVWGSIKAHGLLPDTVVLSDDAGQFAVDRHALCWVHAERLVHKLDTFTDRQHAAQQFQRALIWWFYADLKAYRREPEPRRRRELRAERRTEECLHAADATEPISLASRRNFPIVRPTNIGRDAAFDLRTTRRAAHLEDHFYEIALL